MRLVRILNLTLLGALRCGGETETDLGRCERASGESCSILCKQNLKDCKAVPSSQVASERQQDNAAEQQPDNLPRPMTVGGRLEELKIIPCSLKYIAIREEMRCYREKAQSSTKDKAAQVNEFIRIMGQKGVQVSFEPRTLDTYILTAYDQACEGLSHAGIFMGVMLGRTPPRYASSG